MTQDDQPTATVSYLPLPTQKLPNPFRSQTKKAQSFEIFRAGGNRLVMLAEIKKLGVAHSTANTWLYLFRLYTRGWREGRKGAE